MCSITFLFAIVFTLTVSLCLFTDGEATCNENGWFGPSCQYQCHCANSVPCDKENGSCSSGCDDGWFGPACQYVSITLQASNNWLTDNKDSTCNPGSSRLLYLFLKTPMPLTWIRVVHNAEGTLKPIRILHSYEKHSSYLNACQTKERVIIDGNTMDFNCTTSQKVQRIYVDGEGFKSLCSLYINGGRNVALKQNAIQSTRLVQDDAQSSSFLAEYAVDGRLPNSTKQSASETCTHTDINQTNNWWTVNFTRPVDVTRFLIHNRLDCCGNRLKNFELKAFHDSNKLYTVIGPDRTAKSYPLVPGSEINFPVTKITIQSWRNATLTLCEVQIFGEVLCAPGRFGLSCERQCHCVNQTRCFVHSGGCPAGCAPGYTGGTCSENCKAGKYGPNCSQSCSQNCKGGNTTCNSIDGHCDGCKDGFSGNKCDSKCQRGKYGPECLHKCSQNCEGGIMACSHVDGKCRDQCKGGYIGDKCDSKCHLGSYGPGCAHYCSDNCKGGNKNCDHTNGNCLDGCLAGYKGSNCTSQCQSGKYGPGCPYSCSQNCKGGNTVCSHTDGKCHDECKDGYIGNKCDSKCHLGSYGPGCAHYCSDNCKGETKTCDHTNGNCLDGCLVGYKGSNCTSQCDTGYYGEECEKTCSENCAGDRNPCHHVNGTCDMGCDYGYQGALCTDKCNGTTFGTNCGQACSSQCKEQLCHHVTGHCHSCPQNMAGHFCQIMNQDRDESTGVFGNFSNKVVIMIAVAVVFVVIIAIVSIFICRRRSQITRGGEIEEQREEEKGIKRDDHLQGMDDVDTQRVREETKERKRNSKHVKFSPTPSGARVNEEKEEKSVGLGTECTSEIKPESGNTAAGNGNLAGSGNTAVCVENLKKYILQHSNDSHFEEEFYSVPMTNSLPQTQAFLPENVKKNRYKNIVPYDATRVQLQTTAGKKESDYINASFMQGYIGSRTIISSQGPMDTVMNNFVRMLWEQRVEQIVMLTNFVEEGKKKCSMYWPEEGKKQFDEIAVTLLTVHVFAEYTIRNLKLSKKGEPFRYITQFHFTAWPDNSVPESPWGLVDLYQRVASVQGNGPVLVHCSAGVGRTGTFIGLCNLLQEAEVTGKMDFRSTLSTLRQCRMHSIQTLEQYIFLHHAALVGHMIAGTSIEVKDMYQRISSLESDEKGTTRNYVQEFEALVEVCDVTTTKHNEAPVEEQKESVYQNIKDGVNISKDRLGNIVPNPIYRPDLLADSCHKDTYINAVLVPNLIKDHHDILTQLPLPSTVTDFWRLVTQYNVGLVVAFDTDLKETDESIVDFFSMNVEERFENEGIVVETKSVVESKLVTEMSLSVQQKTKKSSRSLTLLLCRTEEMNPQSVFKLQEKICSHRPMNSSRTVYMCRNGADKSGLICIQSILLERMKLDQCLSVPLVVGKIKSIRPQVIPTVEQYKCLYRVLKLSQESQNVYFNVGDKPGASSS